MRKGEEMSIMSDFGFSLISRKTKEILVSIFVLSFLIAVIPLLLVAVRKPQELRMLAGPLGNAASLSLSASSTSIGNNETTMVSIYLNPGNQPVDAVDVVINFDETVLSLEGIAPDMSANFKTFVPWQSGTENFDAARVLSDARDGSFEFGAVTFDSGSPSDPNDGDLTPPVTGNSNVLIAGLTFRAINTGTSQISFVYQGDEVTTDSNVVSHNANNVDDILQTPLSITIMISQPTATPTSQPTVAPTPTNAPTPTIPPQVSRLNFNLRFQGVYVWRPAQEVQVIARQGDITVVSTVVTVEADTGGVYSGSLSGLAPGVYDILVKGPVHLQKKFAGVILTAGENNQDWSGTKLLAGDAQVGGSSNNKVDIQDLSLLSQDFGSRMPSGGSRADFDFDGDVDVFDLTFISENFGQEGD